MPFAISSHECTQIHTHTNAQMLTKKEEEKNTQTVRQTDTKNRHERKEMISISHVTLA